MLLALTFGIVFNYSACNQWHSWNDFLYDKFGFIHNVRLGDVGVVHISFTIRISTADYSDQG
jgi:hypothetical protein